MIVGMGIDLVSIDRLAESLQSEAFKRRVFSALEVGEHIFPITMDSMT